MYGTRQAPEHCADDPLRRASRGEGTGQLLAWGTHSHGERVIVVLDGELDVTIAPGLAQQLEPLAQTGSHLILDLAALRFCDCAGLAMFLHLRHEATAAGGSLYLTALTPPVRRLITLARPRDLLPAAAPSRILAS